MPPIATDWDFARDDPTLVEMRERLTYGESEWSDIRDEGKTDMLYVALDPWPTKDKQQRKEAGRPCLVFDEIGQYVNQLVNDIKQNRRAIKATAIGNGSNDKTAQYRQERIRQIEYRSNAQSAYTIMAENAFQRSYGFLRISPRYIETKDQEGYPSFEQELLIDALPNPDLVTIDPDILKQTGADMKWAFIREKMTVKDFKRRWPSAKIQDFPSELSSLASGWVYEDHVYVAEYWSIETKKRKLLLINTDQGPQKIWTDDLEKGQVRDLKKQGLVLNERVCDDRSVIRRYSNGVEILEETVIENQQTGRKARSIPIVSCLGKVLYVDKGSGSKREVHSMIRGPRDPQMLFNYYRTSEAELVGMTPKFPYFVYEGQISAEEFTNLQKSLHEPIAAIKVKPTVEGVPPTTILPFPQRQPYEPPIQALEVGAESARRGIGAAMANMPLPTQAQRMNEKSGVALEQIRSAAQKGSFHFIDHYEESITRVGEILEEYIPIYEDTKRDVTVRNALDQPRQMTINDPENDESVNTGYGDHDITLSTGPSFDSQREAADVFADSLAQSPLFPQIADLVIRLKNLGPIGDELADRLTPPQFKKQDPSDPAQMQQQLQQLQQTATLLKQGLDKAVHQIETDAEKQKATIEKAKLDADKEIKLQTMKDATSIRVAEINAAVKGLQIEHEHEADALAQNKDLVHESMESEAGREHESSEKDKDRTSEAKMSQLTHLQTLTQNKQEADLAPEPKTNGSGG